MNNIKERIKQFVKEAIEEQMYGNVDNFTPYTEREKEQNFKGIGRMGNPSYEDFKAWREEGLRRGIPSMELSWKKYITRK